MVKKKLQLNDMRNTILITSQSYMVNQIIALHSNRPVLVSMPRARCETLIPMQNMFIYGAINIFRTIDYERRTGDESSISNLW